MGPGITGLAQVDGRYAISCDEKFKFDVWYIDNKSFYLDIKKVFVLEGISADGEATMPLFEGSVKE